MCRTCGKRHNSYDMDPSSGLPQDVNLEAGGSIPFSVALGKLSPTRCNNAKEFDDYQRLKKENWNLKLRIYLLDQCMDQKIPNDDNGDLRKAYLELQVESEKLKKQLYDNQELIRQASGLVKSLEDQHENQLQQLKAANENEKDLLRNKIAQLEKEVKEHSEICQTGQLNTGDLTKLCELAFGPMEDSVMTSSMGRSCGSIASSGDSQDVGEKSSAFAKSSAIPNAVQGIFSISDEDGESAPQRIPQSELIEQKEGNRREKNRIMELEGRVQELETRVVELEGELGEKERISEALEEDLENLRKELQDQEEKMTDLEFEVTEKDQKVDQLMQDLETRRLEIQHKDSTIQTLHDDLDKVEPEIEVKVQEIIERDRIIEEKIEQLQQQNRILVEIQITLDEKQKQIAELESSLHEAQTRVQKAESDFETSCQTIKEFREEVVTRDKEICQLKKDLRKKEKKIRELVAELKESFEALKKARWEAQTNSGEDGMKEMVEDENEGLWAELEQRKLEVVSVRSEKENYISQTNAKIASLEQKAAEAEEKVKALLAQLDEKDSKKGTDRDKESVLKLELQLAAMRDRAAAREVALNEQNGLVQHLKGELHKAKEELSVRKDEIKELSMKNALHKLISEEIGRNNEVKDLQGKLSNLSLGQDLEALKLILKANQSALDSKEIPSKAGQIQARSNSLSQIGDAASADKELGGGQGTRPTRSNSLSLLENALHAQMGQKVYNTNQTFNTYVIPGTAENKSNEATPLSQKEIAIPSPANALKTSIQAAMIHVHKKGTLADSAKDSENVVSEAKGMPIHQELLSHQHHEGNDENAILILYEEMNKLRNEVKALRQEREVLTEKLSSLRHITGNNVSKEPEESFESQLGELKVQLERQKSAEEQKHGEDAVSYNKQIQTLREELKLAKKRITIQVFELASRKYQDSVKNYKQEIASLRKRLADSHNACDLLRTRLEELVDFLEQVLEMDRMGIINLSHLSASRRASLRKTLDDSRALSHSLSQSLMIGADSLLEDSSIAEEDWSQCSAASLTCQETSQIDLPDEISQLDLSFDFSSQPLNGEQLYQKISSALNEQIDSKTCEIDNVSCKLNQLNETIQKKDRVIQEKVNVIVELQNQIQTLQNEAKYRNDLLQSHHESLPRSSRSIQRSFSHQSSVDAAQNLMHQELLSNPLQSMADSHSSAIDLTSPAQQPPSSFLKPLPENAIFITQERQNPSNSIPPPNVCLPNSLLNLDTLETRDQEVEFFKDHHSDSTICSAYSTDIMVKNLFLPQDTGPKSPLKEGNFTNEISVMQDTLEQPNAPALMLASPSESEAWSEPDRNVSLARIGLEACALTSHDRSLSRARMNRSTPLSSESDAEANADDVKEGTPATQVISSGSKTKRRSEAAEIKRLTAKLRNVEQMNETLRAELHINQTLNEHFGVRKQESRSTQVCGESLPKNVDTTLETYKGISTEIALHEESSAASATMTISSPLLQEIRSLRMKLEEAIANNDLLRDQLEAALAGYLSDEMRNLTSTLASAQQELKQNKDQLIAASIMEHSLKNELGEAEVRAFDLSKRLHDYLKQNQELKKESLKSNQEIANLQSTINKKEEEVMSLRSLHAEETEQFTANNAKMEQLKLEISNLHCQLQSSQQNEMEKEMKVKQQALYIASLESDKADCKSSLAEQDAAITELCGRLTNLKKENESSNMNNFLQKLQESEAKVLQVTKERFALQSEVSSLKAQLASAKTRAKLLQKELFDMSGSERGSSTSSSSDVDYDKISLKLRDSLSTIKELEKERSFLNAQNQGLKKQLEVLQAEASSLQTQLDLFRSKETMELASLQFNERQQLQERLSTVIKEKEMLSERLILKEKELQKLESLTVFDHADVTVSSHPIVESIRPPTYLSSLRPSSPPPSPSRLPFPLADYPADDVVKRNAAAAVQRKQRGFSLHAENKENIGGRRTPFRAPPGDGGVLKESLRRNNIQHAHQQYSLDDDATSGESPDLGIGSDGGQYSSLERNVSNAQKVISSAKSHSGTLRQMPQQQLCTDPSHSLLIQDIEYLKLERDGLSDELCDARVKLRDAHEKLDNATKKREYVEGAISRQLAKTTDVLRRTRHTVRQAKSQSVPKGNPGAVK